MSDTLIVLHTAIAIIAIVLLILVVRIDPVISLVIGTIYLGLAAGLGFEDTIGTIAQGFGDIMIEVGLLIGFGILLGSLLLAMGALQKLVGLLLRLLGPQRLPYAFSAALSTIFPAIYVDVQLVLAAPLARSAAPRMRGDERDTDRRHTGGIRLRSSRSGNRGDSGVAERPAGHDVDLRNPDRPPYRRTYHVHLRPAPEIRAMEQDQG
jgi:hypothetical protein